MSADLDAELDAARVAYLKAWRKRACGLSREDALFERDAIANAVDQLHILMNEIPPPYGIVPVTPDSLDGLDKARDLIVRTGRLP